MQYISPGEVVAGGPDGSPQDQIRRYSVPAGLSPNEKFEHWRSWYASAIDAPVRLEKTERLVRRVSVHRTEPRRVPGSALLMSRMKPPVASGTEIRGPATGSCISGLRVTSSASRGAPRLSLPVQSGSLIFVCRATSMRRPASVRCGCTSTEGCWAWTKDRLNGCKGWPTSEKTRLCVG